jgi:hypothetical protein
MKKLDYFLLACQAGEYRRRAWVISAFALIQEAADKWQTDLYPYRIVQTPGGIFFVDPEKQNELTLLEDALPGQAPFDVNEPVKIGAGAFIPNYAGSVVNDTPQFDMETTYGRLLFNFVVIVYPLNSKIPYINRRVSPSELETMLLPRLQDTDQREKNEKDPNQKDRFEQPIYVDEYLLFCDALFYLAGFTQICVPAATRKSVLPADGIVEFRNKLIAENKDRLHDPSVIAKIDAELVKYDAKYLEGDRSTGFLISKKSREIVRKKLHGMYGAEVGLKEGVAVDLVQQSLSEGWDISKFPTLNNTLRAGSYNRGAQTMLGGETVKWLFRASSNLNVTMDDCGSKLGIPIHVDGNNFTFLSGLSVVSEQGPISVPTDNDAKEYIGKYVMVRSPMFCKLEKTDLCRTCVGAKLSVNEKALAAAVSETGSAFLALFMSAAHSKGLKLAHMDFKTAFI